MMLSEKVGFPPLCHPDNKIADRGTVRLGDGIITAEFPVRK